ncbi:mitochondrial carrier domain-containing protein [Neurospora crassa]|nr:mitochondrial carrier domain-containing protein [Neurospora crassa]
MSGKAERLKDEGSPLQVTAAGATAGLISRFVIAPLDVVKIRLQLQHHSLSDPLIHQRGAEIIGGGPGSGRGNIPAELLYVSYAAVQFTTYRSITQFLQAAFPKDQNKQLPPSVESFIAGASAGGVATAVTYPLDLLRTRFAAQGVERVYPSLVHAFKTIYASEGVTGYFRGLGPGLAQIILTWARSSACTKPFGPGSPSSSCPTARVAAVAGVLASVMAKTGTFRWIW